jgi:hypothetical protein
MTNELINWEEDLAKFAKEVASRERPAVSQIGLRAGVMMYRGQQIPNNRLRCIIISSGIERRYDTKPFDSSNIQPPDCFSLSISGEDMVPAPESMSKQAESCSSCPQNQWLPNPRRPGKNHKPCKERRRLALLPADCLTGGNVRSAELALMALPVTSVKHWGTYVNRLAAEYARPPWAMVTEIIVTPNPTTQFEVKFDVVGPIEMDHLGELRGRIESANGILTQPYDSSGLMVPGDDPAKSQPEKARKF